MKEQFRSSIISSLLGGFHGQGFSTHPRLRPAAAAAARPILQEMLLLSQVRSQISLCTVYVRSLFYGPRLGMDENLHKASQPVDGAKLYSPALTLARALFPQTCGSAPLVSNEQRKKAYRHKMKAETAVLQALCAVRARLSICCKANKKFMNRFFFHLR